MREIPSSPLRNNLRNRQRISVRYNSGSDRSAGHLVVEALDDIEEQPRDLGEQPSVVFEEDSQSE